MSQQKPAPPARIDWRGADMRNVNMSGLSLEGVDMRASDCSGSNFSNTNLRYADFRGAILNGTNFQNANLYGAKMQGVEAHQADFRGANVQLANSAAPISMGRSCRLRRQSPYSLPKRNRQPTGTVAGPV